MAEGKITFSAQPTPTWDQFETVTLIAGVSQVGGRGAVMLHTDVSLEDARKLANAILRSCEIVEADNG